MAGVRIVGGRRLLVKRADERGRKQALKAVKMTSDTSGIDPGAMSEGEGTVKGSIGYFGLQSWWMSAFSDLERRYILETFQPLGASGDMLTRGDISHTSETAVGLLSALAGWFTKDYDRSIAYRLLEKAETLAEGETDILDIHFLYGAKISLYYRDRNDSQSLDMAIKGCRQQIAIAPEAGDAFRAEFNHSQLPSHKGYEQLAIVMEKQRQFDEAIVLCLQAARQGWGGDWLKRVDRCRKKAGYEVGELDDTAS